MALTVAQAPLKLMWRHRTSCVLPTSHRVRLPIHQGSRSKVHIRVTSGAVGGCGMASPDVHIRIPGSCACYLHGIRGFAMGLSEGY